MRSELNDNSYLREMEADSRRRAELNDNAYLREMDGDGRRVELDGSTPVRFSWEECKRSLEVPVILDAGGHEGEYMGCRCAVGCVCGLRDGGVGCCRCAVECQCRIARI